MPTPSWAVICAVPLKARFDNHSSWRLLVDDRAPGDWNMAADEAMLEALRLDLVPPTLRLYRWSQPTLSLGRAQSATIAEASARAVGVERVRRPTGGRSVLHWGDFTYAVVMPGSGASVLAAYRRLADVLSRALKELGVDGLRVRERSGRLLPHGGVDCFHSISQADLAWQNAKLIGSAQLRRGDHFLQHGSLYIDFPKGLCEGVFGTPAPADIADLASVLAEAPAWERVAAAFITGFEKQLGIRLLPGDRSAWECGRIEQQQDAYRLP